MLRYKLDLIGAVEGVIFSFTHKDFFAQHLLLCWKAQMKYVADIRSSNDDRMFIYLCLRVDFGARQFCRLYSAVCLPVMIHSTSQLRVVGVCFPSH